MKFDIVKMEDALEIIIDYRGKTPKKSENGIMTLSAKSVKNNFIDYSQCYYISEEEYNCFMVRGLPKKGDILLTTEAPLGMVARLDRDDVAVAQRLLTLRGKQSVLDNDYLLYYLHVYMYVNTNYPQIKCKIIVYCIIKSNFGIYSCQNIRYFLLDVIIW